LSGDTDLASVSEANNDDSDEEQSPAVSEDSDSEGSTSDDAASGDTGDNLDASLGQLTTDVCEIKIEAANETVEDQTPSEKIANDAADQDVFPDTSIRLQYVGSDK
jgi:hypothetical protein